MNAVCGGMRAGPVLALSRVVAAPEMMNEPGNSISDSAMTRSRTAEQIQAGAAQTWLRRLWNWMSALLPQRSPREAINEHVQVAASAKRHRLTPDFFASTSPASSEGALLALKRVNSAQAMVPLVELLLANPTYRLQTEHKVPDGRYAMDLLASLPAGARREQKYVWGIWHRGQLVGCLDVIRSWPEAHVLYIGFLMIDERWRRHGLASAVLKLLSERTGGWHGIRRWRLAVLASQEDALAFWRKMGFALTGQEDDAPQFLARLLVMEKPVGH